MADVGAKHTSCYWKHEMEYSGQACITMRTKKMRYNYACKSPCQFSGVEVEFHMIFLTYQDILTRCFATYRPRSKDIIKG